MAKKTSKKGASKSTSKKPQIKKSAVKQAHAKGSSRRPAGQTKRYWLVKTEPSAFSIDDLAASANQTTYWDGVRNYQARNTMRDDMQVGDMVLFYHSSTEPPGVAGICRVVREGYPDHTAFDSNEKHFDPKSKKGNPTWYMVDIQLEEKFPRVVELAELKAIAGLDGMVLLQRGSRLSVQPVEKQHFELIRKLGRKKHSSSK